MGNFFTIIFFRDIACQIGIFTRFLFFKCIGKKRSLKSLSDDYKDLYKDYSKGLKQEYSNLIVGIIVCFFISFVIVAIVYS